MLRLDDDATRLLGNSHVSDNDRMHSKCQTVLPATRTFPVVSGARIATATGRGTRQWFAADRTALLTVVLILAMMRSAHPNFSCRALAPPGAAGRVARSPATRGGAAFSSPLFFRPSRLGEFPHPPHRRWQLHRRLLHRIRPFRSSPPLPSPATAATALQMVLTTPESIIEQASTINLLDDLIDESVRTSARRPIMMQFDPSSGWIWRRWTGTVFAETWTSCVRNMVYALAVFLIQRTYPCINKNLAGFGTLWGQLLSVTTFTLTFFVNQSYSLWRKCMELSRRLQGRLHDVGLNMATHAERKVPSNPTERATYTASSRQILELMSRYTRLFNLLTYASFTRSHRPILTPRGMRRLVERGLMTATEREVLVDAAIPATQRHSVVLMWMMRLFVEGRAAGHIQGGAGFEAETLNKFHIIRSQYGAIGDELQGRMPLAYAHIVQVLVDLILWMFPIMAFSTGMSPVLVVLGTGLLTISYQGLFDLAKQFLDPYDNESYGRGEDPLCVDTLIAETNAGSVRWMYGFEEMPFSAQRVVDGEMYDYLLPVRGYSVEELVQIEEERKERERLQEEQRKREEEEAAERLRTEAEEAALEDEGEGLDDQGRGEEDVSFFETSESLNTIKARSSKLTPEQSSGVKANETLVAAEDTSEADSLQDVSAASIPAMAANVTAVSKRRAVTQSTDEGRQMHKITMLATGEPVSFKATSKVKEVVEEAVRSNVKTTNYLATLTQNGNRSKPKKSSSTPSPGTFVPEMVDVEGFEDLSWFDEVGPDGQEIRLSQQLADEVWDEQDDIETKTMTAEEYQERKREIEENAKNELKETIEILSASPGDRGNEKIYTVTERKRKSNSTYDQTRLNGISQLWGLPPEDPSELAEYQPPEKIEDIEFDSVSLLWGGTGLSKSGNIKRKSDDNKELVGMDSFIGISELWGSTIDEIGESGTNFTNTEASEGFDDMDSNLESSIPGLPLHNEKGPDGKEYRLSQLLADEVWSTEVDPVEVTTLTLEDYNKQVEEILTQAEQELQETKAILMSKPGADPLGWDYDEEKLVPMTESSDSEDGEKQIEEDMLGDEFADLEALEMDADTRSLDEKSLNEAEGDGVVVEKHFDDTDGEDSQDIVSDDLKDDRVAAIGEE